MEEKYLTMWFFIVFFPVAYLTYNCLMAFDYQKILRKGHVRELKILMILISIGIGFLCASALVEIMDRIGGLFQLNS